jgi:hypothetical protein
MLGTDIAIGNCMIKAEQHSPLFLKLAAFLARVRSTFHFEVATGYQDETGFHYGVQPRRAEITWPPAD